MAQYQTPEPGYQVLEEVESFRKAVEDFILLVTTLDASKTSKEDFGFIKQINSKETIPTVTWETVDKNRSRNVPSEQIISHDRDVHERSRPEICEISDQVISTSSNTVCIKSDSQIDICAKSEVVFRTSHSTGVSPEYKDIEESHFHNKNMQILNSLGDKRNLNFTENTAYNTNISEKDNAVGEMTDSEDFKSKSLFSVDGVDASYEDISKSELCIGKPKNGSPLKLHSVEMKQNNYESQNSNSLRYYYTTKFYCDVCKVSYSDTGSHDSNQTCNVCKKIFECKVQLEDHYLTHETFHAMYCRICYSEIDKHETRRKGMKEYQCCKCESRFWRKNSLTRHLYTHSPLKLFKCYCCEKRSKVIADIRKHLKKTHPLCDICGKRFVNSNFLDDHRLEHNIRLC